jgi:hypothetical protein
MRMSDGQGSKSGRESDDTIEESRVSPVIESRRLILKIRSSISGREPSRLPLIQASLIALAVGLALFAIACGGSSNDNDSAQALPRPAETGGVLVNEFLTLLQKKDTAGLQTFLSDGFMLQRADGSFTVKAQYLGNLPNIGPYTISDVSANQAGNSLVVRWLLTVEEVIDGKVYNSTPAPRLSTFVWSGGEWRMLSHANFNAPVSNPVLSGR